MRRVQADVIF